MGEVNAATCHIVTKKCHFWAQVEKHQGLDITIPGVKICSVTSKVYAGPHKSGYGIVNNCTLRCTYCSHVPKRDTFYVTDGSPMEEKVITSCEA